MPIEQPFFLAAVVTKVIYSSGTTAYSANSGTITVQPGMQYTVKVEILRNDLADWDERVTDITLDGRSIGGCNPDGGDYDCTFFNCPIAPVTVVSQTGSINVVMYFTGHSYDCVCATWSWSCAREGTWGHWTPVTAVGRFTLTP